MAQRRQQVWNSRAANLGESRQGLALCWIGAVRRGLQHREPFFDAKFVQEFHMSGTMYELCGGFAYLHRLWQPACLTPRLGREMRHTHNIRLIYQADTTIFQAQLGKLFL